MNAIVLSREDADWLWQDSDGKTASGTMKTFNLLGKGTPGYSWLNAVPVEVLQALVGQNNLNGTPCNMVHITSAENDAFPEWETIRISLEAEIERRAKLCQVKK
jgi:hypothetical protein